MANNSTTNEVSQVKRVMVMAGGTGGHIFPGLAVADELKAKGWQVCWLGTKDRMEAQLVPEHGYPIEFIDVVGVRGNGIKRLLAAPFMVMRSIYQARQVIAKFKPDVVIGFGGFASGPGGIAAWLSGVPMLLHEQNAIAGFTNRVLAHFAKRALMAFPDTFAAKHNARLVGNPVRNSITDLVQIPRVKISQQQIKVLLVGGSLGAQVLNEHMPDVLAKLNEQNEDLTVDVWHQTGKSRTGGDNVEQVIESYELGKIDNARVSAFIDDMTQAYQWADVVICRSGALTVAEVAAAGLAAVFVPFPHAVDDHQTLNARWLTDAGAALTVQQRNLAAEQDQIIAMLADVKRLNDMGDKARQIAIVDATQQVAQACIEYAKT